MNWPRPLDGLGTIKRKLGVAIVVAVGAGAVVSTAAVRLGMASWLGPVVAALVALGLVQVLARGMTSPLREMARAARRMADGDWDQRVVATSADEVGDLGRAFNDMAREMAAVDRMRRDLVANVSHELRTPITALAARLENLVDGVDAPSPELFDAMLSQTRRLGRLVEQLLDLSRLESGAVPVRREPVDVAPLLESVAAEARLARPDRVITVTAPDDLVLSADPDRLHQVLGNLVSNALAHAPGSPVALSARRDRDLLVVAVDDEGPGVDDPERVFERFWRSDGSRAVAGGGAGLGLAIARWIVELHGGDLRLQARHPHGCRALLHLPLAPDRSVHVRHHVP